MEKKSFNFLSEDGMSIVVYQWLPSQGVNVKGIVQIAHGMAETALRYEGFAKVLTENGYLVYANDHRGHGKTAGKLENLGILAEEDGFELLVRDMYQLTLIIKESYPNIPVFLFGHSMGSFASQRYIMHYGKELAGVILSGSNGRQSMINKIGFLIAKQEVKKNGRNAKSFKMNKLSFGNYNQAFQPNRTEYDWLSRDNEEVDKYINNPYCGGVFTAGFFHDFLQVLIENGKGKNIDLLSNSLPIFIVSGDKDPVGDFGKGLKKLYHTYKKHGMIDVSLKLYPEGRHELLNEINKEEVMNDLVHWMNLKI